MRTMSLTAGHHQRVPKMMTQVPIRMVHPRGYNDRYDTYSFWYHEINMALFSTKTTEQFAYIFRKYGDKMTDNQIAYSLFFIGKQSLDKSP